MKYIYNHLLEKIENFYEKKTNLAIQERKKTDNQKTDNRLEDYESSKFSRIIKKIPLDMVLFIVVFMAIGILGFFSFPILDGFPSYLFGFVFFVSGVCVGTFEKGFGILFLFSHGVTGLVFMESSLLGNLLNSPILTDAPKWFPLSAGIVIFLFIVAILSIVIHNFSDTVREIKYFKIVPLICIFLALLLTIVFTRILL